MKTLKQSLYTSEKAQESSPFIIAEISGNHKGSLERALQLVDAAADAKADAVKLQTFTPDSMTLNIDSDDFKVMKEGSPWYGRKLYDLYKEGQTRYEWHKPIFDHAATRGIICFSSAFSEEAVDFLEDLNAPAYKIASFENVDIPLIRYAAATGKPLIISTGMASAIEILEAVEAARDAGCTQLSVLKCTTSYPADPIYSNLRTIPHMQELLGCTIGLSDHTLGIGAAVTATALGATVIEKHITLSRTDGAVDSSFSAEPQDMANLVKETRTAAAALGTVKYGPTDAEIFSRGKRRSIYVSEDISAGNTFTASNVRRIRPGKGIAPKYWNDIIGKTAKNDIKAGNPLAWNMVSDT